MPVCIHNDNFFKTFAHHCIDFNEYELQKYKPNGIIIYIADSTNDDEASTAGITLANLLIW